MKHTGGGWYELSNGEKVRGKANAEAAEAGLTGASDGNGSNVADVYDPDYGTVAKRLKAEAKDAVPKARVVQS